MKIFFYLFYCFVFIKKLNLVAQCKHVGYICSCVGSIISPTVNVFFCPYLKLSLLDRHSLSCSARKLCGFFGLLKTMICTKTCVAHAITLPKHTLTNLTCGASLKKKI